MKAILNLIMLSGILVLTNSCQKEVDNTSSGHENIYIVGRQLGSTRALAKYWVNGVAKTLTDGNAGAVANSIFVTGNDIYVAGNDGDTLKFWKNGVATKLTDGKMIAYASSLFVHNNDVYVVGAERDSITLEYRIKYWKNGVGVDLTAGSVASNPKSIIVTDNDIYIMSGKGFLKNGTEYAITDGGNWIALRSLAVSGNDVYVAGNSTDPLTTKSLAKYWKNGQPVTVSTVYNSEAKAILVIGNTIHLLLNENGVIKYWKDGTVTTISDAGYAYDFAIYGNDVFIAGNELVNGGLTRIAKYWKNGVGYDLGPDSDQINLRSIFITGQ